MNTNLRYLKKEATVRALADAAFALAVEHGLDGFIVDDVVNRAGYSRRTFANHFSCKEEAVATGAMVVNDTIELEQLLEHLPDDTSPIDILFQLIQMQLSVDYLSRMRELALLCRKYPAMEPYFLDAVHRLHVEAKETLISITNGNTDEVYIHLLVGAVYGAMLPVVDGSLNVQLPHQGISDQTFQQYLKKIYKVLKAGF